MRYVLQGTRAVYAGVCVLEGYGMCTHRQWREGDENVCTCGLRWCVGENDPHGARSQREINRQGIAKLREILKKPIIVDEVTAEQIRKRNEKMLTQEKIRLRKIRRAIEDIHERRALEKEIDYYKP